MDIINTQGGDHAGTEIPNLVRIAQRARRCAAALSAGAGPAPGPDLLSGELAYQVLPHLEGDLRLAAGMTGAGRGRLLAELNEHRLELGRMVEELDRLLLDAAARPGSAAPRRRLARSLDAVALLLDRHLATDRELRTHLEAEPDAGRPWALRAGEAEASERLAARSLRFVWHPPVGPTEARARRKNPNETRVVILDAADASAARSAAARSADHDQQKRRIER